MGYAHSVHECAEVTEDMICGFVVRFAEDEEVVASTGGAEDTLLRAGSDVGIQ